MLKPSSILAMLSETLATGGATFDLWQSAIVHHSYGYLVGLSGGLVVEAERDIYSLTGDEVFKAIESVGDSGRAKLIGLWLNDGKLYVDPVRWVESVDEALELGAANGQGTIWDCAKFEVIPVPKPESLMV